MYSYYEITDEIPDSFVDIVRNVFQREAIPARHMPTPNNRTLLFLIWLRCYPSYHMLSSIFKISVTTVKVDAARLRPPSHRFHLMNIT